MASRSKRVGEGRMRERRLRRSGCVADALRLQLEACREEAGLEALVVSDELGFCVAHAGGEGRHEELAARLPLLADPAQHWSLEDDEAEFRPSRADLAVTTFSMAGSRFYVCSVRKPDAATKTTAAGTQALARVASGFTRLLTQ